MVVRTVCKANHISMWISTFGCQTQAVHPGPCSCSRETHHYSVRSHQDRGAARESAFQGAITHWPPTYKPNFQSVCTVGAHPSARAQNAICARFQCRPSSSQQPFSLLLLLPPRLHAVQGCESLRPGEDRFQPT